MLVPEQRTQLPLHFFPVGKRALVFGPAGLTQGEPSFPAVLPGSTGDPASAPHDGERAGERGAIDGQNLPECSLGNFSGEGQGLQESELRASQAEWPESPVVVLGQHARGATETRAHAGKSERCGLTHNQIDAYTYIAIQENRSRWRRVQVTLSAGKIGARVGAIQ